MEKFEVECILLSKQHHPNIVLFMGVYFKEGEDFPALMMELLPMSLDTALTKYPDMPVYVKNVILYDVACGLSFLHSKGILHRDLTSRNVLLTECFHAKIADLGVARILCDAVELTKFTKVPGNALFMPPEACTDDPDYDTSLDMFSYGVLILNTVTQKWPTPGGQMDKDRVVVSEIIRRKKDLDVMGGNHPLRQFTERCLSDHGAGRPTAREATDMLYHQIQTTARPFFKDTMEMTKHIENLHNETEGMKERVAVLQETSEKLEGDANEAKASKGRLEMEVSVLNEQLSTLRRQLKDKETELWQQCRDLESKESIIQQKGAIIEVIKTEKSALMKRAENKVRIENEVLE
jgi:serine/threonine protein kinase